MADTPIRIFISYRRDHTAAYAGRLQDRLVERFGESNIFMDVGSITAGTNFHQAVITAISSCQVLLAIIGPSWVRALARTGVAHPREVGDWVRLEIRTALDRNLRVIPVLVESTQMPPAHELPPDLEPLVRRQALRLRHIEFRTDARPIIEEIASGMEDPEQFGGSRAANEAGRVNRLRAVDGLYREKLGKPPVDSRREIDVLLGLLDEDEPILNLALCAPPHLAKLSFREWRKSGAWRETLDEYLLAATTRRLIFVGPRHLTTLIISFSEVLAVDSKSIQALRHSSQDSRPSRTRMGSTLTHLVYMSSVSRVLCFLLLGGHCCVAIDV